VQLQLLFQKDKYQLRTEHGELVNEGPAKPRSAPSGPYEVSAVKSETEVPMPTDPSERNEPRCVCVFT
jgi:hypothetical protein